MKKRMIKILALVLAAVMMLGTGLTACAKEGSIAGVSSNGLSYLEYLIASGAIITIGPDGEPVIYLTSSPIYGPEYQFGDVPVDAVVPGAVSCGLTNEQIRSMITPSKLTPGGTAVYGWYCTDMMNGTVVEWPDIYLNAIDEAGITSGMSDYEKCAAINNYLCNKIRYDIPAWKGQGGLEDQLLASGELEPGRYGEMSLKYGIGVCYNYADAFVNMAGMLGIPCNTVVSRSLQHAWNEVYIDGVTYHLDITWNDTDAGSPAPNLYFMSTERWADHQAPDLAYEWGDGSLFR